MSLVEILRAFFGLSIVIGLILGLAYVLRRYAPALMAKMTPVMTDLMPDMMADVNQRICSKMDCSKRTAPPASKS